MYLPLLSDHLEGRLRTPSVLMHSSLAPFVGSSAKSEKSNAALMSHVWIYSNFESALPSVLSDILNHQQDKASLQFSDSLPASLIRITGARPLEFIQH